VSFASTSLAALRRRRGIALCALALCAALGAPGPAAAALFAPDGAFGSAGTANGRFAEPAGIDTDDAGRVYVADSARGRLEVYDDAAAGNKFLGTVGDGVLVRPVGVTLDIRDRIYVTDEVLGSVVMFDAFVDGHDLRRRFGKGDGTALGYLSQPRFAVTDRASRVYVTERGNARVQWLKPTSRDRVEPVAAFGVGEPPEFLDPEGLARDGEGRVYVSDQSSADGEVRLYDPRGFPLGQIIGPGSGAGQVSSPRGLMRDPFGRLLVADSGNSRVQVFAPLPETLDPNVPARMRLVESYGSAGTGPGNLLQPAAAALAPGALLYVTDAGNGRVVRLHYDDADTDGALDERDNCPGLANPRQRDTDRDRQGDECDPDDDNDTVADASDRCPTTRRGQDANRDGCGDPRSRILIPGDRATFRSSRPPTLVAGRASADELGVTAVEIALAQVRGRTCRWYRPGGRFGPRTSCAAPQFFAAKGLERWRARFGLRGRGSYRVLSRATQRGGLVELPGDARDTQTFRIR